MIREAAPRDMETLLDWRMEVLDHVFPGRDLSGLRAASRQYYQGQLGSGHIACFALEEPGNPAGYGKAYRGKVHRSAIARERGTPL